MSQQFGSAKDSQTSGRGESEWVPMAAGLWRFEIGKPSIELSGFKNDKGDDQYRVIFPIQLTQSEYERAKETTDLDENQQLSGRSWYRVGLPAKYPLGFYRDGGYVSTKLADFWCTVFGSKQTTKARKYLEGGGGPDWSQAATYAEGITLLEEWLGWIEGCQVYGSITHSEDKKTPGKFWPNFGGPLAVGALPGQPEPDYHTYGMGKLRALTSGDAAPGPQDVAEVTAEQGVAEGAALSEAEFNKRQDEQKAAVQALRDAEQPEMLTAPAAVNPVSLRLDDHEHVASGICQICYSRMFGEAVTA